MTPGREGPGESVTELLDQGSLGYMPWLRFLLESQDWEYAQKRRHQLRMLRALALEFDLAIESWEDFGRSPLRTKADIRQFAPHNPDAGIRYETSGSSGVPFTFLRDRILEPIDYAVFNRAWRSVGRTDQLMLRLVAGPPKWAYMDGVQNVVPMNYRTMDETYADWVVTHRPFLIHGVAGAIRDLVERVVRRGQVDTLKDTRLYLMSEDTRSHQKALGPHCAGVYMGYGTSECRTVASQCRFRTLHVNMETTIAESVDDELVVTNLFNRHLPFVRYRTGDKGKVVAAKRCECGVVSDAIEELEGKQIDYYYDPALPRPIGWWIVSPISHQYGSVVSEWRVEVFPKSRRIRVYAVPKAGDLLGFQPYLDWLASSTSYSVELVPSERLPDWRRKLIRVVEEV